MSTSILNEEHGKGFYFCSFHAGDRGLSYQITTSAETPGYVQLTAQQMHDLLTAYMVSRKDEHVTPAEPGKWPVLTRAEFLQQVLSIWDTTAALFPQLKKEYAIAHEWLTRTWTVEELAELSSLQVDLIGKPAWWKFWRNDRETFAHAWTETKLHLIDARQRFMF